MINSKLKITSMYDAVFKKIMSENIDILAKVLETILGSEIKDFKILTLKTSCIYQNIARGFCQ